MQCKNRVLQKLNSMDNIKKVEITEHCPASSSSNFSIIYLVQLMLYVGELLIILEIIIGFVIVKDDAVKRLQVIPHSDHAGRNVA